LKPGLLLIDLQRDFLARPGLAPHPFALIERSGELLESCRSIGIPVVHVHTRVAADGADRMPHWRRAGVWSCVAGTPGAEPPAALEPRTDEVLFTKRFYSAFGDPALEPTLRNQGVDTLIVAGNYLHGCVRATVLDAYESGFQVWVADDAVGSTETDHAELTRLYLEGRAASFLTTEVILERLGVGTANRILVRRNPSSWEEIIAKVPIASREDVAAGCEAADCATPIESTDILRAWAAILEKRTEEIAHLLAHEIGKPVRDGREEVLFAAACARAAAESTDGESYLRPHGVVGLITPWNNPVGVSVGKIAPALAFGNRVVWKAAVEAPGAARAVIDALRDAGLPQDAVRLLFGGAETARALIDHPITGAVSLTGSVATGRSAAVRCARRGKPLQAELGGNNAAIVLSDCHVEGAAPAMARSAFSFAGQRCTATRRFVVEREILAQFQRAFVGAVESLRVGDPHLEETDVGPLVSQLHRDSISASLKGVELLCGGDIPAGLEHGCWLRPAVVVGQPPDGRLALEESFGPVALILPADDLEGALAIANGVEQGLAATLYSSNASKRRRFSEAIEAGLVKLTPGPFRIDPSAPFGGWKASGLGPPEHGRWDREFYTRPQALYGDS
jgi:acyl-CoA reductase-like NAD-dependent aldehyde dehydrogenase